MSQAVEKRTPQQELVAQIRTPQFLDQVRIALPGNVTPDRFVRAAVTAVMQNPDLAKADPASVIQATIKCAQDGLLPDGREAALVIFGGKAVYMSMIGGLRKIAAEHGWSIRTQVVYENDKFDVELGMTPTLTHTPVRPGAERGPSIAAYAVAQHRDGRLELEVLTAADIEKVRRVSRAKDSGPWKDWPERMWEKTAGRRLFAKLPLGEREQERIARVIEASYEPEDAAAALYGPDARQAYQPIEGETSGASAVPGEDPDPEPAPAPPEEPQASFQIPDQAVEEAGQVTVHTGSWKGYTVAGIAEAGEQGVAYLGWILRNQDRVRADVYGAVSTFVRGRLPHLIEGEPKG